MTSDEYRKLSILLSGIKNGSRDAFADIFEMYNNKVYFLCCKLLKNTTEAKNLTIDIFAYTYLQVSNLPGASSFEKWLYTTVFNHCRRYLINNRPEVFGDYIDSNSPEGEKSEILLAQDYDDMLNYPDGIDVSIDIMQTADSILSEMPQKIRNVAILHYFCGFEGEEIAKIEQISFSAYKNRLYKARIRLKTEEHKYTGIGYNVHGMVTFFADVLSTMADSIVVPNDIASSVTARTGINCIKNFNPESENYADDEYIDESEKGSNYKATKYATAIPPQKQGMSPAVKVLMAIIAIIVIIAGTVAVMLAIQNRNNPENAGTVDSDDPSSETTTEEATTEETTTQEASSEAESVTEETTTQAETTTQETTTESTTEATTEIPIQTTTETTTQEVPQDEEPVGGENNEPVYIEPLE